jgi:hypothetical protein
LAVLVFSAAAKHLKRRDRWIGWTRAQCDRRLSLVVNNSRFLILPRAHFPNLGSRERQPKPRSLWFTDFQAAMGEDNLARAFAFVTNRRPKIT